MPGYMRCIASSTGRTGSCLRNWANYNGDLPPTGRKVLWEVCFVYGEVFLGYTEKRKACFLPATRKRLFANSDFALRQRAEGFQRAIGKPFGRLRRGEILCDTGKRKVGPFPACRKEAVLYTNFYLLQRAEGFQRATGKPFGRLRKLFCQGEFAMHDQYA